MNAVRKFNLSSYLVAVLIGLSACSTQQQTASERSGLGVSASDVEQIGSLESLRDGTAVVWSKNLVHSGVGALINQRVYEQLAEAGISGIKPYEETNVLEVSPRFQVVWFFKQGQLGGGDKQLFIHALEPSEARQIVSGERAAFIVAVVDIQMNRLVWRSVVRRADAKASNEGILQLVDKAFELPSDP